MTHGNPQEGYSLQHGIYEDRGDTPDIDPGLDFMRRYRAIGASALSASADLRERTVATWDEVSPKLEELYDAYPTMRPEVRLYMQRADDQFKHLIGLGSNSRGAPAERASHRLGLALDGNEEAEVDIAVAYAADAVVRSGIVPPRGIAIRRPGGNSVFARGDVKRLVAGQRDHRTSCRSRAIQRDRAR